MTSKEEKQRIIDAWKSGLPTDSDYVCEAHNGAEILHGCCPRGGYECRDYWVEEAEPNA